MGWGVQEEAAALEQGDYYYSGEYFFGHNRKFLNNGRVKYLYKIEKENTILIQDVGRERKYIKWSKVGYLICRR